MKVLVKSFLIWALWSCQPTTDTANVQAMDALEFKEELGKHAEVLLLDIRTPQEIAQGKIAGAIELDYYQPDFEEKVNQLDRSRPVFVYCAVGGRSQSALPMLQKAGFKEIYHLSSGIQGWVLGGYPLQK